MYCLKQIKILHILKHFNACISYDSDYDLSNKTVEITLKNLTEEEDYDKTVIQMEHGTLNGPWVQ